MNHISMFRRSQGFTILELMISLSLGLLISLAAVQLFVTNQANFQLQRGLSDVSENGRFALDFMAKQVRQGFYAPSDPKVPRWPPIIVDVAGFPTGTAGLAGMISQNNLPKLGPVTAGQQGGIAPSDRLTIQYYTPNATVDCEGQAVPAGSYVLTRFFMRADAVAGTASALACEGGYHTGAVDAPLVNFVTTDTAGVVLMSAADNFQVLLGVANTAAGANMVPQRYMTIATYTALAAPRPPVSAVKLGLLVSSTQSAGNLIGTAGDVTVLDQAIPGSTIYADNRVRRLYANTVILRNVLTQ